MRGDLQFEKHSLDFSLCPAFFFSYTAGSSADVEKSQTGLTAISTLSQRKKMELKKKCTQEGILTVGPSRKNFKEGPDLGSLLEGCSVSDLVEDGEWRFAGSGMEKQVNRGYKDGQRIRKVHSQLKVG